MVAGCTRTERTRQASERTQTIRETPMKLPLSPLLLLLTGCASRHLRIGDDAAHAQDWRAAYASYERATSIRPGSASAQQRLREARDEVMALLDGHLDGALRAHRYAEVGELLSEARRYDPPRSWLAAHTDAALAAVRAEARAQQQAGQYATAHALLSTTATSPALSALATDRDQAAARWAADLREQADSAANRGALGAAVVLRDGALALSADPASAATRAVQHQALLAEEWGGVHLTVRGGAAEHKQAVQAGLQQRWSGSRWSAAPMRSHATDIAHVTASIRITESGCGEAMTDTTGAIHRYTDGTFAPNPRVQQLSHELLETARALRAAEDDVEDARLQLDRAQDRQAAAEAAVAAEEPRLQAAEAREEAAVHQLEQAAADHASSVASRQDIEVREAEISELLDAQRERNRLRHALEQGTLPERSTDQESARRAHHRAAQAFDDASTAEQAAQAALDDATRRLQQAEQALAGAAQAFDDLGDLQAALRAATEARKSAAQAHQAAVEAAEQASAALTALEADPGTTPDALQAAIAARDAAVKARKQSRSALNQARTAEADHKAQLAELTEQQSEDRSAARQRDEARDDREAARDALQVAAVDRAQAESRLQEATARLTTADEALAAVQRQLDQLDREDADQARRLSQLESEIRALGSSLSLISDRQEALHEAQRDREAAARRLASAQARMAPLRDALRQARQRTTQHQQLRAERERERRALADTLRTLQAELDATPGQLEVVKEHRYTVETWTRTCTFTVAESLRGTGADQQPVRSSTTTSRDRTWAGFAHGGLAGDPLQYETTSRAALARSREAVIETVWADLSGQVRAEASTWRQRARGPDLEESTRAWLVASWLDPSSTDQGIASAIYARYGDLPR